MEEGEVEEEEEDEGEEEEEEEREVGGEEEVGAEEVGRGERGRGGTEAIAWQTVCRTGRVGARRAASAREAMYMRGATGASGVRPMPPRR